MRKPASFHHEDDGNRKQIDSGGFLSFVKKPEVYVISGVYAHLLACCLPMIASDVIFYSTASPASSNVPDQWYRVDAVAFVPYSSAGLGSKGCCREQSLPCRFPTQAGAFFDFSLLTTASSRCRSAFGKHFSYCITKCPKNDGSHLNFTLHTRSRFTALSRCVPFSSRRGVCFDIHCYAAGFFRCSLSFS